MELGLLGSSSLALPLADLVRVLVGVFGAFLIGAAFSPDKERVYSTILGNYKGSEKELREDNKNRGYYYYLSIVRLL